MPGIVSPRRRARKFLRDDEGTLTIEAVLWLPVFILILSFIVDVSLLFNAQTQITRLVQDTNRNLSVKYPVADETAAENYIRARLGAAASDPETVVKTWIDGDTIYTTVQVRAGHFSALGFFKVLNGVKLTVNGMHLKEL